MDVITFGEIGFHKTLVLERLPEYGGTSLVLEERSGIYGSAYHIVRNLSSLGLQTAIIGIVGDDQEGRSLTEDLRSKGVDTSNLLTRRGRTSMLMTLTDGVNSMTIRDLGVIREIQLGDVNLELIKSSRFLHFSGFSTERGLQLEKQLVLGLMNTSLSVDLRSHPRQLDEIRAILQKTHVAFADEATLRGMTSADVKDGASELISEGARLVAVLLEGHACYIFDGSEEHLASAVPVDAVDRSRAYDAFISAVLASLVRCEALDLCAEYAVYAVASVSSSDDVGFPPPESLVRPPDDLEL